MKTAISIPDELFEQAEAVRKRLGISRSEFYSTAVEEHLRIVKRERIKERLDANYADQESRIEEELVRYQASVLPEDDW